MTSRVRNAPSLSSVLASFDVMGTFANLSSPTRGHQPSTKDPVQPSEAVQVVRTLDKVRKAPAPPQTANSSIFDGGNGVGDEAQVADLAQIIDFGLFLWPKLHGRNLYTCQRPKVRHLA